MNSWEITYMLLILCLISRTIHIFFCAAYNSYVFQSSCLPMFPEVTPQKHVLEAILENSQSEKTHNISRKKGVLNSNIA